MKKSSSFFKAALVITAIICSIIPKTVLGYINNVSVKGEAVKKTDANKPPASKVELPVVGSYENFKKLMEEYEKNNAAVYGGTLRVGFTNLAGIPAGAAMDSNTANAASKESTSDGSAAGNYSTTNVQVQGVDESDIVKTDGEYIYHVNNGRIVIMKAYPVKNMKVEGTINYSDDKFSPFEMYVDNKYLVVIGSYYYEEDYKVKDSANKSRSIFGSAKKVDIYPPRYGRSMVKAIVYDISSRANPKQLREIEIEGGYVSSRKIGSRIYFVTNKYLDYYLLKNGDIENKESFMTPLYKDSARGISYNSIDYSRICYFPGVVEPNYMIVAGLNIENLSEDLNVQTYLGAGQNIYVSQNNLYAAAVNYKQDNNPEAVSTVKDNEKAIIRIRPANYNINTIIYRFSLEDGIRYTGSGEVPGTILNQFSMDEKGSYFRVATTKGEIWRNDENTSKNNLYVLDEKMKTIGSIEDIAPGEMIYSVRFMGDRAYMITFRTVDPLFVIDLKDPQSPKILGKLKIPGYSNYLHPYDENHIIGFGKEAVEVSNKDSNGRVVNTNAYYLGMKIAIFDVSDVNNPKEKFKTVIGGRGTESELLHNHRALLFSKDKNLLAFPVNVMEGDNYQNNGMIPEYGKFTFQGAYVYNIDLLRGMTLKGKISHLTEEDYMKSGDNWNYENNKNVQRILYINDVLYTISNSRLMAHNIQTMTKLGEIQISQR